MRPVCDLLCCCDSDCEDAEKEAFQCKNNTFTLVLFSILIYLYYFNEILMGLFSLKLSRSKRYCVPGKKYFTSNTPYILKEIEDLICVEKESKKKLNLTRYLHSILFKYFEHRYFIFIFRTVFSPLSKFTAAINFY